MYKLSHESLICNEQCDFVIRNFEACIALNTCYDLAKTNVPKWIYKQLENTINCAIHDDVLNSHTIERGDDYLGLFPNRPHYDITNEVGLFFGIEGIETIMQPDENNAVGYPHIYLFFRKPENISRNKLIIWDEDKTSIKKIVGSLTRKLRENNYLRFIRRICG